MRMGAGAWGDRPWRQVIMLAMPSPTIRGQRNMEQCEPPEMVAGTWIINGVLVYVDDIQTQYHNQSCRRHHPFRVGPRIWNALPGEAWRGSGWMFLQMPKQGRGCERRHEVNAARAPAGHRIPPCRIRRGAIGLFFFVAPRPPSARPFPTPIFGNQPVGISGMLRHSLHPFYDIL